MSKADRIRGKIDHREMFKKLLSEVYSSNLHELNDYIEELEKKFEQDLSKISIEYDKVKKDRVEEDEWSYLVDDSFAEDFFRVQDIFIKNFRYSSVVTLYSILESSLNDLCQQLQLFYDYNLKHVDLAGKGIERAINYLEKVCTVGFNNVANELSEIRKMNSIRNCIVHAEGNVTNASSTKKITNIVSNIKGVSLSSDKIIIEKGYIEQLLTHCDTFMTEVIEQGFATTTEQ